MWRLSLLQSERTSSLSIFWKTLRQLLLASVLSSLVLVQMLLWEPGGCFRTSCSLLVTHGLWEHHRVMDEHSLHSQVQPLMRYDLCVILGCTINNAQNPYRFSLHLAYFCHVNLVLTTAEVVTKLVLDWPRIRSQRHGLKSQLFHPFLAYLSELQFPLSSSSCKVIVLIQ